MEEKKVVINEPITNQATFAVKGLLSVVGLLGYISYYRWVYVDGSDHLKMRVWEDLYGRGLGFFLCSAAHYLYCSNKNEDISFFELEASKRYLFALRLATTFLTFVFLALAISQNPDKLHVPLLVILLSISAVRLVCSSSANIS